MKTDKIFECDARITKKDVNLNLKASTRCCGRKRHKPCGDMDWLLMRIGRAANEINRQARKLNRLIRDGRL